MKITVTLLGPTSGGATPSFKGGHAIVSIYGVWIDGKQVIERDRRMKSNRVAGHPWIAGDRAADTAWQSFKVIVEPDA